MPGHLQDGFGCVVTNRFDQLLDDESDPFEILKAAENRRKEAAAPGAKPTTTAAAQSAKGPRREPQRERRSQPGPPEKREEPQPAAPPKKDGVRRPGRKQQEQQGQTAPHQQGAPGERRPERRVHRERRFDKPMEEKQEGGDAPIDKATGERPPRGRGGGRGGRGGRGRGLGRGEGFESRGKREFDRHSGSERTSQRVEEKRAGTAVPHTWTNAKDEPSDQSQPAAPETPAEGEEPTAPADSENKENEVEEVKEDSPKEMTLDEWKAMQNKERAKVEFNIRKPNEGDEGQWKKGYVLHKSKTKDTPRPSGTLIEAGETNADSVHKVAADDSAADHHIRKPANDITSQLEINFGDLGRPGRGRGGSRGGRGGRGGGNRAGRGGSRSDKGGGASVPNVDDPEAFPALA